MAIRGPSAKGLDCVSGARVRIPLSPYGTKKPVASCSRFLFFAFAEAAAFFSGAAGRVEARAKVIKRRMADAGAVTELMDS